MRVLMIVASAAAVVCLAGCKFDEGYVQSRLARLDELAAKADPATAAKIKAKKAGLEEAFKKLPTGAGRADAVHELGRQTYEAVGEAEKLVEAAAKGKVAAQAAAEQAAQARLREPFVGVWKGGGMDLTIQADGKVAYARKSGASSRNLSGTIASFSKDSFKVSVLGVKTTFKIDAPPAEGPPGVWSVTIDGVKLHRVGMPGQPYVYGIKLCAAIADGYCLGPREAFRSDEIFNVIYDTQTLPKPGDPIGVRWIAEKTARFPADRLLIEAKTKVEDYDAKTSKTYTTTGFLKPPEGGHPEGTLRVEIWIGGALVGKKSFAVANPPRGS